jgi:hypothetical protein
MKIERQAFKSAISRYLLNTMVDVEVLTQHVDSLGSTTWQANNVSDGGGVTVGHSIDGLLKREVAKSSTIKNSFDTPLQQPMAQENGLEKGE